VLVDADDRLDPRGKRRRPGGLHQPRVSRRAAATGAWGGERSKDLGRVARVCDPGLLRLQGCVSGREHDPIDLLRAPRLPLHLEQP